jgi:CheY-like chemotaxis protein
MELEGAMREGGFSPVLASTGEEALSALDGRDDIRAIVTDINLGQGITGWDVARRARELHPEIPIVYVSSVSREEWSAQGVPESILIHKPFAPAQIITAISQMLNEADPDEAD